MVSQNEANPEEGRAVSGVSHFPLRFLLARRALILGALLLGSFLLALLLFRWLWVPGQEELGRRLGLIDYQSPPPAPAFRLRALGGKTLGPEDFRGRVVLLNFWATWCPPCRREMPSLERLYQEFKDEGFVVLAISEDIQGERVVAPFMKENGLTFPALLDPEKRAFRLYDIRVIPTTYLIDRDGKLVSRAFGAREWDGAEGKGYMARLLKK